MKAVILAGGLGTRISEETGVRPKPMVEVGGKPVLWHIMKIYSAHGINEFIICCGYRGYVIKEYFANYFLHTSDVTFDMKQNQVSVHQSFSEPWKVTVVDTGDKTMTGGRLGRVRGFLENEDSFCFTYGDGLADIDIGALLDFHRKSRTLATVTATIPPARFGALEMDAGKVRFFKERPSGEGGMVSGGFFVLSPKVLDLIESDETVWEREPLEHLARVEQLAAYPHEGFWQPLDTLRDKLYLEELWQTGQAPWKVW